MIVQPSLPNGPNVSDIECNLVINVRTSRQIQRVCQRIVRTFPCSSLGQLPLAERKNNNRLHAKSFFHSKSWKVSYAPALTLGSVGARNARRDRTCHLARLWTSCTTTSPLNMTRRIQEELCAGGEYFELCRYP
jgi:hypothetical protein